MLNFPTIKNLQIIRVCTKLHNFVIYMAQVERKGRGRIGPFQGNRVDPSAYGIAVLNDGGQNGNSIFGFLELLVVDDDIPASFWYMDFVDCWRNTMLADTESNGI